MKNFKKIALAVLLMVVVLVVIFIVVDEALAINVQLFDTNWTFKHAIIKLADGTVVDCSVKSWKDFEDGDQIQVTTTDGITYLVHSMNCTLIHE